MSGTLFLPAAAGRDTLIPREQFRDIHDAASEPKKFLLVPDATHHDIYRDQYVDEVADAAARWLGEHLSRRGISQAEVLTR